MARVSGDGISTRFAKIVGGLLWGLGWWKIGLDFNWEVGLMARDIDREVA